MNSVERVLAALNHQVPDRVPFAFGYIHPKIRRALIGEPLNYDYPDYRVDWSPVFAPGERVRSLEPAESTDARVARRLGLDALGFQLLTPVMAELAPGPDGTNVLRRGLLTPETFPALERGLPDPDDDALYTAARQFVRRHKGEFALFCRVRLGFSPTLISMGSAQCLRYIKEEPGFVRDTVAVYARWMERHLRNLMECGFDFIWSFDDMASREKPYFTVPELRSFFLPYLSRAAAQITVPWIFHSDGNLFPVLPELLTLGMSGLHPLEPGAMDLEALKEQYGRRLCLVGNIDIDHTMTHASPEEMRACVDACIRVLAPGGGYMISDSNSVPARVSAANISYIASYLKTAGDVYERAETQPEKTV